MSYTQACASWLLSYIFVVVEKQQNHKEEDETPKDDGYDIYYIKEEVEEDYDEEETGHISGKNRSFQYIDTFAIKCLFGMLNIFNPKCSGQ